MFDPALAVWPTRVLGWLILLVLLRRPALASQKGGETMRAIPRDPATSQGSNASSGLVADLCRIIERQSQEIAGLVHGRPNGAAPESNYMKSSVVLARKHSNRLGDYSCEAEVRACPLAARSQPTHPDFAPPGPRSL